MKNTATLTWVTYQNFGTFLQAYALQHYLLSQGYNNHIVNDADFILHYRPSLFGKVKNVVKELVGYQSDYIRFQHDAQKAFEDFKERYLSIDYDTRNLNEVGKRYDTYICGSDQIWSVLGLANNPYADFFYASFTDKKKIAYAPSVGAFSIPKEFHDKYRTLLSSFTFLSAREPEGQKALQEITHKEVVKVVDPTLLLSTQQWNELVPITEEKEKYVLGYFLTPNPHFLKAVREYAQKRNLKIKLFYTSPVYKGCTDSLITAGPLEFLSTIKNAEFVFTDSFHGSIFASIFHTQFITFLRFRKPNVTGQNSRVINLLSMMGIPERLLDETDMNEINLLKNIDFTLLHNNLKPYIESSKAYLHNALQD